MAFCHWENSPHPKHHDPTATLFLCAFAALREKMPFLG